MMDEMDFGTAGADALREAMGSARRRFLKPPPRMTVDEWADSFRYLARGTAAKTGRWKTSTVEVARGPMRAVTEPGVRVITVKSSTQLMKSSLLENVFGYFATLDPCPILLVEPKDEAIAAFSKERIGPMVTATPALRSLVGDPKSRNADNTMTFRRFPGGFIAMVAAGSPTNLAMRPIRVALLDEIDKYAPTREGPAVTLAEERLGSFADSLSIRACSPTDENSAIAISYDESDQRRAFVSCPHCQHRQVLDFFRHVQWEKDEHGEHRPATARIFCESCGAAWEEHDRLRALTPGNIRWAQTRPFMCCDRRHDPLSDYDRLWRDEARADAWDTVWRWDDKTLVGRAVCRECGKLAVPNTHAGFTASKLYSPHANDRPAEIARKWLLAKDDPERRGAWFNTQLGLEHKAQTHKDLKPDTLMARREVWPAPVPDGVAVLTCGVDWQGDRCELEVVGWGRDEESWSVDYQVFHGDAAKPEIWDRLDAYLTGKFLRADGRPFTIDAVCMDSGHHTQEVYAFCRPRTIRRVWAIKGDSARYGKRTPVWPAWKPSTKWRDQFRPILIGVNAAKDTIRSRLVIDAAGPGYCHFPHDRDAAWFDQLTAEKLVMKVKNGVARMVWTQLRGRANEALDCRVYAFSALCGLQSLGLQLNRRSDEVGARRPPIVMAGTPEAERLLSARAAVPITEAPMETPKRSPVFAMFETD